MDVTEFIQSADIYLLCYIRDISKALEPDDEYVRKYLQTAAWTKISLLPGDADRQWLMREAMDTMLRRTDARLPEIRRARAVVRKYISETVKSMV